MQTFSPSDDVIAKGTVCEMNCDDTKYLRTAPPEWHIFRRLALRYCVVRATWFTASLTSPIKSTVQVDMMPLHQSGSPIFPTHSIIAADCGRQLHLTALSGVRPNLKSYLISTRSCVFQPLVYRHVLDTLESLVTILTCHFCQVYS